MEREPSDDSDTEDVSQHTKQQQQHDDDDECPRDIDDLLGNGPNIHDHHDNDDTIDDGTFYEKPKKSRKKKSKKRETQAVDEPSLISWDASPLSTQSRGYGSTGGTTQSRGYGSTGGTSVSTASNLMDDEEWCTEDWGSGWTHEKKDSGGKNEGKTDEGKTDEGKTDGWEDWGNEDWSNIDLKAN